LRTQRVPGVGHNETAEAGDRREHAAREDDDADTRARPEPDNASDDDEEETTYDRYGEHCRHGEEPRRLGDRKYGCGQECTGTRATLASSQRFVTAVSVSAAHASGT
jgi:hypothetical protein